MANSIVTPSGQTIQEGSIVILARFPGVNWVAHNGWYTYQGNQFMGWYFASIPSQTIMPLSDDDLIGIQIVSGSGCTTPSIPAMPPCPPPAPPAPPGCGSEEEFTHEMKHELDRAWITVDTLEQLNRLNIRLVPDGKIVRVNDIGDGSAKYYRYNQPQRAWQEETFGVDTSNFVSKQELEQEVMNQLENVDFTDVVTETIKSDSVQEIIKESSEMSWYTITNE